MNVLSSAIVSRTVAVKAAPVLFQGKKLPNVGDVDELIRQKIQADAADPQKALPNAEILGDWRKTTTKMWRRPVAYTLGGLVSVPLTVIPATIVMAQNAGEGALGVLFLAALAMKYGIPAATAAGLALGIRGRHTAYKNFIETHELYAAPPQLKQPENPADKP